MPGKMLPGSRRWAGVAGRPVLIGATSSEIFRRMKIGSSSIFANIPETLREELFEEILGTGSFRLERIVSRGHASPNDEWYDQDRNEWVIVVQGRARLEIEGAEEPLTLGPGDHVLLPANLRHRVQWTDPGTDTVWLALHF